jgi:hypothetical protein
MIGSRAFPNRALFMERLKRETAKPNADNLHVIC